MCSVFTSDNGCKHIVSVEKVGLIQTIYLVEFKVCRQIIDVSSFYTSIPNADVYYVNVNIL